MSTLLAELVRAENSADAERRAVGRIPEVLREPGATYEAYTRWEAAREALSAAREAETDREAGIMSASYGPEAATRGLRRA
jgi:hypothetical protein